MKMIPIFKCLDMKAAIVFYTSVLDFEFKYIDANDNDSVVDLINNDAELQLTIFERDTLYGSAVNVWVDDVDGLFEKYKSRGLDQAKKKDSPVHQGPINQTWGTREFYVTDSDGNTLRFVQPIDDAISDQ
ncbi:MAG: glyoxalase superfamily protein [Mucilaginibacter sp.]|uniref:glyoxalase superfamily protein n=1 Tax=Mucilaginibacter sp. TaxID=1882438 RepID=UPI003265287D